MGLFIDPKNRTPELESALAVLRKLPERLRCVACYEILSDYFSDVADKKYGPETKRGARWWGWIKHKREPANFWMRAVPRDDHPETRETRAGDRYYISQPYSIGLDGLDEIVLFCKQNDLDCTIDAGSWYFPSATLVIAFESKEQVKARYERSRAEYERKQEASHANR